MQTKDIRKTAVERIMEKLRSRLHSLECELEELEIELEIYPDTKDIYK